MTRYILQRIGFALLTILVILVVVYLLTAQFSLNPFAQQWISSDRSNISIERSLYDQSVANRLIPDLPFEDRGDWFADSAKLNPFIRMLYWFQDVFNSEKPFGVPFNPNVLTSGDATTIPGYFFGFLRYTLIITVPVFVFSVIFGVTFGVLAGYKRGKLVDTIINGFTIFFTSIPSFVLAPIVITILLLVNIPSTFYQGTETEILTDGWGRIILSWLPPIGVLTVLFTSNYVSYARNQVITVLTSNYVLIAKSKGLGNREIFLKYVLRNISIPLVTLILPSFIGILSGGVVIETYWRVPGTSRVLVSAFPSGEINLIMFNVFFFTSLGVFIAILVDVLYVILDPRIKYSENSKRSLIKEIKAKNIRNKLFKEAKVVHSTAAN